MSYDRYLSRVCPHQVIGEALYFRDRQIVRPLRPIAATISVKLVLNRLIDVPSEGVYYPAVATGTKSGPFDIISGNNDSLVIKVGNGLDQVLTMPAGKKVPTETIVRHLNKFVKDAYFEVSPKQRLVLKTMAVGPEAIVRILDSSTSLLVLGYPLNLVWRGQTIVPGWSVVSDPNTLGDRPHRLIVFDQPLKGYDDFVEIDYTTVRQECRRCGGLGVENDWQHSNGKVVTVVNEDLLNQEFTKMVYTIQGSNPFHLWYGTGIINAIGRKVGASGIVQNMIATDIQEAFRRWQSIKKYQEETVNQAVSDEEFPFRLSSVNVTQNPKDPTIFNVETTIQNRSSRPITIERRLKVPSVIDDLRGTSASGYTLVR